MSIADAFEEFSSYFEQEAVSLNSFITHFQVVLITKFLRWLERKSETKFARLRKQAEKSLKSWPKFIW